MSNSSSNKQQVVLGQILYRVEEFKFGDQVSLKFQKYKVDRITPAGFWVKPEGDFSTRRWTSKYRKYPFAYSTKEKALQSYIERKRHQFWILSGQIEVLRVIMEAIVSGKFGPETDSYSTDIHGVPSGIQEDVKRLEHIFLNL